MQVFRGLHHALLRQAGPSAVTVGNFDGVHRGHQAMLALLKSEAEHRGLVATVLSFEPHPRDYFAVRAGTPEQAPARIATLRDKLAELARCGVERTVVMPFDQRFCSQSPQAFIDDVLVRGLDARYVLVGDDFRFGARRAGDYAMLDAAGEASGFDVARMMSYEVHGLRVSSSAVREALAGGDMALAARLLGRPYSISGHVVHGRKIGRALGAGAAGDDGFRTLNLRFPHRKAAASGIFVVRVHGLSFDAPVLGAAEPPPRPADAAGARRATSPSPSPSPTPTATPTPSATVAMPLEGVASLGVRPTVEDGGRVLLEVHCFDWPLGLGPEGGYGKLVRVELLHKLRDEARYDGLAELTAAIAQDECAAREWLASGAAAGTVGVGHAAEPRQTSRDRILPGS